MFRVLLIMIIFWEIGYRSFTILIKGSLLGRDVILGNVYNTVFFRNIKNGKQGLIWSIILRKVKIGLLLILNINKNIYGNKYTVIINNKFNNFNYFIKIIYLNYSNNNKNIIS